MPTNIAWTDESWNPVTGCTPVSEGCAHCYARTLSKRFGWSWDVTLHPDRLEIPLHWRKPQTVFVCSRSDLFHEDVPFEFVERVWDVMFDTGGAGDPYTRHTYQILTKRPQRLLAFAQWMDKERLRRIDYHNVWLGVSVENQASADERIPLLLDTPAAVRFVSAEPLLGPLDLGCVGGPFSNCDALTGLVPVDASAFEKRLPGLDWVIVGAESGPGARLMDDEWARDIKNQCVAAGVDFFFKQRAIKGRKIIMPELDGQVWDQIPGRTEVRA